MAAVFVSASDESAGKDHLSDFQCTGFVAPERDWDQFFAPAWQERVLDGPPKIEYLHMTEMRSRSWREKKGITRLDAENRFDEAANIIHTLGSLYPVKIKVNGPLFHQLFGPHKMIVASGAQKRYEPDYYCFNYYVYAVLARTRIRHPEAERVDFLIESKSNITAHIKELYDNMPNALRHIKRDDLVPLLGNFIPGTKDRPPLQAADFLCWHSQRADAETLDISDIRRWNPIAKKAGFPFDVPENVMRGLAEAFARGSNEEQNGLSKIRRRNAKPNQGSTRTPKGRARRRKTGKGRKAEG